MDIKTCTKCGETKPVSEFNKCRQKKDGLHSYCRSCNKVVCSQWSKDNPERKKEGRKADYAKNMESYKKRARKWREENKERKKELDKRWREENKERKADIDRRWFLNNKKRANKNGENYRKRWPERNRERVMKRFAAKMQAIPAWADMEAIKEFYATALPGEHVDHIVPLQGETVCGLHCEANLQHLPASENISKGNYHWPDMWHNNPHE